MCNTNDNIGAVVVLNGQNVWYLGELVHKLGRSGNFLLFHLRNNGYTGHYPCGLLKPPVWKTSEVRYAFHGILPQHKIDSEFPKEL